MVFTNQSAFKSEQSITENESQIKLKEDELSVCNDEYDHVCVDINTIESEIHIVNKISEKIHLIQVEHKALLVLQNNRPRAITSNEDEERTVEGRYI